MQGPKAFPHTQLPHLLQIAAPRAKGGGEGDAPSDSFIILLLPTERTQVGKAALTVHNDSNLLSSKQKSITRYLKVEIEIPITNPSSSQSSLRACQLRGNRSSGFGAGFLLLLLVPDSRLVVPGLLAGPQSK
eukprot:TRINITY_DN1862_c0_g2_i1.p1 TRINITY_DN1862_c0_g2~~TRINITY_DN1862_c0_g2_i1.p1  ORF type:complete len:132 (+),score=6.51 TRINITY_DN1862_c0_g2_i1:197-592(+)